MLRFDADDGIVLQTGPIAHAYIQAPLYGGATHTVKLTVTPVTPDVLPPDFVPSWHRLTWPTGVPRMWAPSAVASVVVTPADGGECCARTLQVAMPPCPAVSAEAVHDATTSPSFSTCPPAP
jgi:hypothetical protein